METRKNSHQLGPNGKPYQNYQCANPDCRYKFRLDRPPARKRDNLILAWSFSHNQYTLTAYNFLQQLSTKGNSKTLTIVSDGLPAHRSVIPLLLRNVQHLVYKAFDHLPNNNVRGYKKLFGA